MYPSFAQRHVAEQIDALYWAAGDGETVGGGGEGEEILRRGADFGECFFFSFFFFLCFFKSRCAYSARLQKIEYIPSLTKTPTHSKRNNHHLSSHNLGLGLHLHDPINNNSHRPVRNLLRASHAAESTVDAALGPAGARAEIHGSEEGVGGV